jgi:HlyD family secretion protein
MSAFDSAPFPAPAHTPSAKPRSLPELIEHAEKRRRARRHVWIIILAALPALALAAWIALRPRPVPIAQRFRTQVITRGDIVREVRATGHVEAVSTVSIGAEISGRIMSVDVDYNDRVKAGQILARFDRTSLEAQLAQSRATLAAGRAALAQATTDRDQARRTRARADQLVQRGSISEADHDAAVAAEGVADQRARAAEYQMAAQAAAHTLARTNLDHAVIRSPIDGVVITRNIDPGQTVASVLQTPVLFTVARDLRKMRVIAAVDEADVGEVLEGQRASFSVNAYGDRAFEGVVTEVRNSPVIVQDVVTYGTVVEVDNPDLLLKPGMTASVRVRTASAHDVLKAPNAALHFVPPGEEETSSVGVWTIERSELRRVAVKPGIGDGEWTEIAPEGLTAGTPIIVELTPEGRAAYGLHH